MLSSLKGIMEIINFILGKVVLAGTMVDIFRYYVYVQLIINTALIIGFSIYGFEELNGFGKISIELELGYTYVGFLAEIANLMFWLSLSSTMFSIVREGNRKF